MMAESDGHPGLGQYQRTPRSFIPGGTLKKASLDSVESAENQLALTGVFWDAAALDLEPMRGGTTAPSVGRVRARMRARLPELIWSTAALEGNTFTLPEVQTLLDGVTVEGKKLEEQQQVIALQETFNFLDELVVTGHFRLDQHTSDEIHRRVARHEAIESGHFRGLGSVTGGGNVRLSTGETVSGLPSAQIPDRFAGIVSVVSGTEDPRLAALIYFAAATRSQFYFDGNKRTARMMASGLLLTSGFDALYIPFERRLEYNRCLDALFTTNDATPLMGFIASCAS